jgi:transposase-like protein
MQKSYSEEFKESVIKKMMPPNPVSVSKISKETGVSDVSLYKWRKDYRNRGIAMPGEHSTPDDWTADDKLAVVIETASLNGAQLSEYCRCKGLYPEQIDQWKTAALSGYQHRNQVKKENARNRQEDKQKIKRLESELKRKEKALAETAALLVLSKKCEAIWGVSEED